jgi:hypothetical protein
MPVPTRGTSRASCLGSLDPRSRSSHEVAGVLGDWAMHDASTDNGGVAEVSARLSRWVVQTFPAGSADFVLEVLRAIPDEQFGRQDPERVQAAIVLPTNGDWNEFVKRRRLARDWRDVLVAAQLAQPDWPDRLDAVLGPR